MESHNVSRHRLHPRITSRLAGSTLFQVISFPLRKNPNIIPVKNAVRVNPGKYAADGKISMPSKSPIAYPIPAQIGPYKIPIIATGRNPNPIRTIGVWIEQNLVRMISSAIRNARTRDAWY